MSQAAAVPQHPAALARCLLVTYCLHIVLKPSFTIVSSGQLEKISILASIKRRFPEWDPVCLKLPSGCQVYSRLRLVKGFLSWPPRVSPMVQQVKNPPAIQKTQIQIQFLGQEDPLEKEMTTHSRVLAWRIPGTEESGRLSKHALYLLTNPSSDMSVTCRKLLSFFIYFY